MDNSIDTALNWIFQLLLIIYECFIERKWPFLSCFLFEINRYMIILLLREVKLILTILQIKKVHLMSINYIKNLIRQKIMMKRSFIALVWILAIATIAQAQSQTSSEAVRPLVLITSLE